MGNAQIFSKNLKLFSKTVEKPFVYFCATRIPSVTASEAGKPYLASILNFDKTTTTKSKLHLRQTIFVDLCLHLLRNHSKRSFLVICSVFIISIMQLSTLFSLLLSVLSSVFCVTKDFGLTGRPTHVFKEHAPLSMRRDVQKVNKYDDWDVLHQQKTKK